MLTATARELLGVLGKLALILGPGVMLVLYANFKHMHGAAMTAAWGLGCFLAVGIGHLVGGRDTGNLDD